MYFDDQRVLQGGEGGAELTQRRMRLNRLPSQQHR